MKPGLRLLVLLAVLLASGSTVRASHTLGGQLTYEYIGTPAQPNLYRLTCLVARHCSGIVMAAPSVSCRVGTPATACTTSDPRNTVVALTLTSSTVSDFNCPSTGNACNSTSTLTAFNTDRYTGTVELPPAPNWTLTTEEAGRPTVVNTLSGNLFLQTTLSNQLTLPDGSTQTVHNSAPLVPAQTPLVYLAAWNQHSSLTFTAYDADGDSLAYALVPVLDGCNQPATYRPFSSMAGLIVLSLNPPCIATLPTVSGGYSPTFPVASLSLSGTCPAFVGTPSFTFNRRQGSFTFRPAVFDDRAPVNDATTNLYMVAGQITKYRKLNGRYYPVGTVRRDMAVQVVVGVPNRVPASPVASGSTASNTAGTDSLVVEAGPLSLTTASFQFADADAGQQLALRLALPTDAGYPNLYTNPAAPDVPVTITGNGTANPVLQVRLRPSILGRTYRIPLQIEDNACPVKAIHHYVLVLRATGRPTATQPVGAVTTLRAFPNPFTEQVSFRLPRPRATQTVLVYDPLGRVVAELPVPAGTTPEATLTWTPAATLPIGVYTARATDGGPTVRMLHVRP